MGEMFKNSMVGLPMSLFRAEGRGAMWRAELEPGQQATGSRLSAHGTTEASATQALSDTLTAAFARLDRGPVLVVGGSPDHANCLHLILPEPHAWVVWVVRERHRIISWHGDSDRDDLLRQVLEHVGGQPAVITFRA